MAQEYHDKYNDPNAIQYPKVDSPGRVMRDKNGNYVYANMSYKEYFDTIGVGDIYVLGSTDPEMFKKMQYSVINFLGFVGYQFSEQDVWFLNYYEHLDAAGYRKYYVDVPNSTWANGVRDKIINFPDGPVHVTDVNTWGGIWIGKNGINSFEDFKDPDKQDFIAKDHFALKYGNIVKMLNSTPGAKPLEEYLNTYLYWDKCTPSFSPPPGGRSNQVLVTMSGLLAGAHLRGAQGVVDLLVSHKNNADEIGTTILQYVQDLVVMILLFINKRCILHHIII